MILIRGFFPEPESRFRGKPLNMDRMKILIDNGHGRETPGKRSPDGRLREYAYTREIAGRVAAGLKLAGMEAIRIVPEERDIPLSERVARVNRSVASACGEAVLVSVHCNALGDGSQWTKARGWSVFTDRTASQQSIRLAEVLARTALGRGVQVRQPSAACLYWMAGLYICRHSKCPAVLVENFFQDNPEDVAFLLSESGKCCVASIIVEGVKAYCSE